MWAIIWPLRRISFLGYTEAKSDEIIDEFILEKVS